MLGRNGKDEWMGFGKGAHRRYSKVGEAVDVRGSGHQIAAAAHLRNEPRDIQVAGGTHLALYDDVRQPLG
jgi:hypothetical protein